MALRNFKTAALLVALLLGGCSTISDLTGSLFSSNTVDDTGEIAAPEAAGADQGTQAPAVSSASAPATANPGTVIQPRTGGAAGAAGGGSSSGTIVARKATELRADLGTLQSRLSSEAGELISLRTQTVQDSETYHGTVAAIEARLQVGTTPGNPILTQQWTEAQGELAKISGDVQSMNDLTQQVAATSAMAGSLLDAVRAARTLPGGVDEDFRDLSLIEDQTNTTSVGIDRLLGDLSTAIQRQQVYVANERGNLNILALAIQSGQMYAGGSTYAPAAGGGGLAAAPASLASGAPTMLGSGQTPLVVIRFDRPNVDYQDALYTAVKAALDRAPGATFDVVAVTPASASAAGGSSTSARRNAEQVARVLTQMGLPSQRVVVSTASSASAGPGEVQVFVR